MTIQSAHVFECGAVVDLDVLTVCACGEGKGGMEEGVEEGKRERERKGKRERE